MEITKIKEEKLNVSFATSRMYTKKFLSNIPPKLLESIPEVC